MAQLKRIQALATAAMVWGLVEPVLARCDVDMQKLVQGRNTQLEIVNNYAKSFHGKPMDAEGFCIKSAGLILAEQALIAYMEANKEACSFRDTAIDDLKAHHVKNAGFNTKACAVAAAVRTQREQAGHDLEGRDRTVVPLISQGGTFTVPVTINGQLTLDFVVDSGAADVSMPADVVMTLVRTGTISDQDFLGKQTYQLADGSTVPSESLTRKFLVWASGP